MSKELYYAFESQAEEITALKKEIAALKEQLYTPVATLLNSDPHDDGFWVSSEDKQRLTKLPSGTTLFIMIDKP